MGTTQNSYIDYNEIMKQFQKDSNEIFHNNVEQYTINDRNFLHGLNQLFGNALSAKGINVLDPIYANFFHYNKMNMLGNADYPRVTRTYCFFTRPELNFSIENLTAIPFFKWLYSKPIGKMIMCSLTDPEYFIGGPAALSNGDLSYSEIMKVINDFANLHKKYNKQFVDQTASAEFKSFYNSEVSQDNVNGQSFSESEIEAAISKINEGKNEENIPDDPVERARLEGVDLSNMYDASSLQALDSSFKNAAQNYQNFMNLYSKEMESIEGLKYAFGVKNKNDLSKELHKLGIHQAKHLLRHDDHNNPFDDFNFTSPFIPLLSNTCLSLTGVKDFSLGEHTYEEDEFSATIKVPTGMDELWGPGTVSATFTDIAYGPVSLLFMVWIMYIHYVSRGNIMTTREHVIERILDYTCSIYIFVIGDDGRRIERWGKLTGCFPTQFPMSSQLEHNTSLEPDMLQKLTISFTYNRYEAMDPQVFTDFNFLSESEWLVKLKRPLWEEAYDRNSNLQLLNNEFFELSAKKDAKNPDVERLKLHILKRPSSLWETVSDKDRGMSGKLPMALVEPAPKSAGLAGHNPLFSQQSPDHRKHSEWYIDTMTNFWGGYPYINKGSELVWVLPQWSKAQDIYKDESFDEQNYKQGTPRNGTNQFEDNTGYSKHAIYRPSDTKAPNGFFIGNATLQNI